LLKQYDFNYKEINRIAPSLGCNKKSNVDQT